MEGYLCHACHRLFTSEKLANKESPNTSISEGTLVIEIAKLCVACEALEQAQSWYDNCLHSHPQCKIEQKPYFPTRVLDLGPPDGVRDPYLFIKKDRQFMPRDYAALSYCWGSSEPLVTTKSNIKEREQSIMIASFPKTIRNAVFITKKLGIQYLWVDALCILQGKDDEARTDWQKESAQMDEIYGNAVIMLVAGASVDCDTGIFRSSVQGAAERIPSKSMKMFSDPSDSRSIQNDPINLRAWTLQERLLSHRVLSFWSDNVSWQCQAVRLMQNNGQELIHNRIVTYNVISPGGAIGPWLMLVQDYSRRLMEQSGDKLVALSGIAKKMQSITKDIYIAGLWRKYLFNLLLWRVDFFGNMSYAIRSRPTFYRAPSWSWAAVDGNIVFGGAMDARKPHTEIIDCFVEPVSKLDPFGAVKYGELIINGPVKEVLLSADTRMGEASLTDPTQPGAHLGGGWLDPEDQGVFGKMSSSKRYCLLWASRENESIDQQFVLLLAPLGGLKEHYIRVGTALIDNIKWFDGVPKRKVTIF